MTAARIVLMVLLTVSLDLSVPFVPTPGGLQWDDDEEVVHLRRSRADIRLAGARQPSLPQSERPAPALKVPRPSVPSARREWRLLLWKTAVPPSDSPSSPQPP